VLSGRALVAQLNDVHPAGQRGVGEFGQVAMVATRIGAQIKTCRGESVDLRPGDNSARFGPRWGYLPLAGASGAITFVHTATLATTVGSRHGSPGHGG
jgi:hypothetical protein